MPSTCEPFHQSLANICLPDTNNSPQSTSFAKNCALLPPQAVYVAVSVCNARKLSHSLNSAVKHASLCLVCTVKACDVRAPVWFLHLYLKEASSVHFQVGQFEQGPNKVVQNCLAAQISCVDTSTSFQQQLHGLKETKLHAPAINPK